MWYKFSADHGPGHQGHTEYYKWCNRCLTKDEKEEIWENLFRERDWPIGKVQKIKKLPEKEREKQILKYKSQLNSARYMLKILKEEIT